MILSILKKDARYVYITGGRGRLAGLVADRLVQNNRYDVVMFSRRDGHGFCPVSRVFDLDALAQCRTLLHMAWSSFPANSEQNPGLTSDEDLPMLTKLLSAIAKLPMGLRPHFVFFSSGGAVYGNASWRPSAEADACAPIGQYGRAKRLAEELLESFARQNGISYTIIRISNPYGYAVPGERMQGIIPRAIDCAFTGSILPLWGDGSARKDFIHYVDFLDAIERVVETQPLGIFNICRGKSYSLNEVFSEIEKQAEKKIVLRIEPEAPWDVKVSALTGEKMSSVTGWAPKIGLPEGIRLSIMNYLSAFEFRV